MLSEKIYALRRKSGLSQEALAEKIGVSRQAVSKWETGAATPEFDKLRALCACFGVTLDELTGGDLSNAVKPGSPPAQSSKRSGDVFGIILCITGAVCLVLYGVLMLFRPEVSERISNSSVVTLSGSGLLLLVFALLIVAGASLIFRKK